MPTHLTDTERIAVELQSFLEAIEQLAIAGVVRLPRGQESEAFALLLDEPAPSFEPPVKRLRPLEPPDSPEPD